MAEGLNRHAQHPVGSRPGCREASYLHMALLAGLHVNGTIPSFLRRIALARGILTLDPDLTFKLLNLAVNPSYSAACVDLSLPNGST